MDFKIQTDGILGEMTFEKADNILNNVFLSMMIPKGGWVFNPDFGSRLHLLQRAKNTDQTAALARGYCKEALQWLLDVGRATKIEVATERDREVNLNRLKALIEVTQANKEIISFVTFIEVV